MAKVKGTGGHRFEKRLEKRFNKRDVNGDGALSGTETKKMETFDTNSDGQVSKEEFAAGRKANWKAFIEKKAEDLFAKKDVTKDGAL